MIERKKKKKKKKEISRENRGSTRTISREISTRCSQFDGVGTCRRLLPHRYTSLFAFFRCHRFQFRAGQLQNWITFDSLI